VVDVVVVVDAEELVELVVLVVEVAL